MSAVTSTTVLNTNPIIAAIPSMLLALIIVFLGSYTLANRHLWKVGGSSKWHGRPLLLMCVLCSF